MKTHDHNKPLKCVTLIINQSTNTIENNKNDKVTYALLSLAPNTACTSNSDKSSNHCTMDLPIFEYLLFFIILEQYDTNILLWITHKK